MSVTDGSSAPIRYARSGDVSIAYQVTGEGPIDLVLVPGFFSPPRDRLGAPGKLAAFFERLGSFARLIRFDKRGTGLSDRAVGLPDLETRMDDVRAVMDAVGVGIGGPVRVLGGRADERALRRHLPERARALVLYGSYATARSGRRLPWAPTWEDRERCRELEATWGENVDLSTMVPGPTRQRGMVPSPGRGRRSARPGRAISSS